MSLSTSTDSFKNKHVKLDFLDVMNEKSYLVHVWQPVILFPSDREREKERERAKSVDVRRSVWNAE